MSTILADLDVIAARQRQVEAENQRKINTLEDENVKLLRERGDIAKRIKSLQDLRIEQRQMLLRINKLNNVSDPTESLKNADNFRPGSGDSLLPASAQPAIKSALRNDSNRFPNPTTAEPSAKKAKNANFDSLNEDFIPFSSNNSTSSTVRGNGNGHYGEGSRFNGNGNGNSFQAGKPMPSGQNDLGQKSKEELYRRAQENSARRRLVDNPCTFFSEAGNCKHGNLCLMSHDVVPKQFCGEYNEIGTCHRSCSSTLHPTCAETTSKNVA